LAGGDEWHEDVAGKLCEFCRQHHLLAGQPLTAAFQQDESDMAENASKFLTEFNDFVMTVGGKLYSQYAVQFLQDCMGCIASGQITIHLVGSHVLQEKDIHDVFDLLITAPDIHAILSKFSTSTKGAPDARDVVAQLDYNVAMVRLCKFATAIGATNLLLPSAVSSSPNPQPYDFGKLIMQMECLVRNMCLHAAVLHRDLLVPLSKSAKVKNSELFGPISDVLSLMNDANTELEALVVSPEASSIEGLGVKLTKPMALIREWRVSMSFFARGVLEAVLKQFNGVMATLTDACRLQTPAWEVIFVDGMMDRARAEETMGGKLKKISAAHDALHDCLKTASTAATKLSLTPRLQDHPVTSNQVLLSLTALASASVAATIASGVDLLALAGETSSAKKAEDFVLKHKDKPKNKLIPECFWSEFEAMATLVRGPSAVLAKQEPASGGAARGQAAPRAADGARPGDAKRTGEGSEETAAKRVKREPVKSELGDRSTAGGSEQRAPQEGRKRLKMSKK